MVVRRLRPVDRPPGLARRLAEQGSSDITIDGFVCVADVSDFTRWAEELGRSANGLSDVRRLLQAALQRCIESVVGTGGEIVAFEGDGLVAWWPETTATDAPLECARRLAAPTRSDNGHVHAGLAFGKVRALKLGGLRGEWHYTISGPALNAARDACHRAGAGEVSVSPELGATLAPGMVGPHGMLTPHSAASSVTDEWPLDASRIWESEVRTLVPIFFAVSGAPLAGLAFGIADQVVRVLQELLGSRAGYLDKVMSTPEALILHAAFGLPGTAHRDDLTRAIDLALELDEQLASLGLRVDAGISVAEAYCGHVGTRERAKFMMVGSGLNLAARIMQCGEGVLLPASDGHVVGREFGLLSVGERRLRGFSRPMELIRPSRQSARAPVRMHGRSAELLRGVECLDRLEEGESSTLLVVGDAGLGKSLLAARLSDEAERRGLVVLTGEADAVAADEVYRVWRPVVNGLLGTPTDAAEVQAAVAHLPHLHERLPLLSAVVPIQLDETELTRPLDHRRRAEATLGFLVDLIAALATELLVVVLEDAHWMDSASWRLLERLSTTRLPVLYVLCSRPMGTPPAEWAVLLRRPSTLTVELTPLDAAAIAEIVVDRAGREIDPSTARLVHQQSGGNPFLAGVLAMGFAPGSERSEQSGRQSVAGLVQARLDGLSEAARVLIRAASVLGRGFSMAAVEQIYPLDVDRPAVRAALDELVAGRLIDEQLSGQHYRFQHDLIRETTYQSLLLEQRVSLHRAAAHWLSDRCGAEPGRVDALVAHHWDAAGDRLLTLRHSDRAGQWSLRSGAFAEAVRFVSRCLELDQQQASEEARQRHVRWRCALADAHHGLGDVVARGEQAGLAITIAGHRAGGGAVRQGLSVAGGLLRILTRPP
ncbi:MAG: hypothetical protein ACI9WU_001656, partial [Myxococcota bacterium]